MEGPWKDSYQSMSNCPVSITFKPVNVYEYSFPQQGGQLSSRDRICKKRGNGVASWRKRIDSATTCDHQDTTRLRTPCMAHVFSEKRGRKNEGSASQTSTKARL